jgi:hypothetical protein
MLPDKGLHPCEALPLVAALVEYGTIHALCLHEDPHELLCSTHCCPLSSFPPFSSALSALSD